MRITKRRLRQIISEEIDLESQCVVPTRSVGDGYGDSGTEWGSPSTIIVVAETADDVYGWCTNRVCGETGGSDDDPHAPKRLVDIHRGDRVAILVHKPDEPVATARTAISSLDGEWVIEGVVCEPSASSPSSMKTGNPSALSMIRERQYAVKEPEDPTVREGYQISNRHLRQIIREEISCSLLTENPVAGESEEDAPKKVLLVGDSQMAGAIGRSLQSLVTSRGLTPITVSKSLGGKWDSKAGAKRFYITGAPPSRWLSGIARKVLDKGLSERPDLIVVNLGGNGSSGAGELYSILQGTGAEIVWVGAPPPVYPTGGSSTLVNNGRDDRIVNEDGTGAYVEKRAKFNRDIRGVAGGNFVDPYDSDIMWGRKEAPGDGVHVRDPYAQSFVNSAVSLPV